jgi:DNA polymerase/3'-5' exonuclease PolX
MEELEKACLENKLVPINGLGVRIQTKILEGIAFVKDQRERVLYTDALPFAEVSNSLPSCTLLPLPHYHVWFRSSQWLFTLY